MCTSNILTSDRFSWLGHEATKEMNWDGTNYFIKMEGKEQGGRRDGVRGWIA